MVFLRQVAENQWVRWLAPLVILIIVGIAFRDQLHFIDSGIRRLSSASWPAILLVIATAAASLIAMAEVMRLLLGAGGTQASSKNTIALTMASNSWSTTLPGGPAFSAILTFQIQRGWGASVILCGWFFILSSAISTMWLVVIGGAAVFYLGAQLSVWSLLATLVFMAFVSFAVYWAANHPVRLERWVRSLLPRINRLLHREATRGLNTVVEQIRQLETVSLSKSRFAAVSTWSLANRVFDALALWACIWAVTGIMPWLEAPPDHTTILGVMLAYTTAKIAGSAQVTPGGLGTVEAAIIGTLVASGMTAIDATGAAVIYRLISFVLMTIIGWVIYFLHYAHRGIGDIKSDAKEPTPLSPPKKGPL